MQFECILRHTYDVKNMYGLSSFKQPHTSNLLAAYPFPMEPQPPHQLCSGGDKDVTCASSTLNL